jgi:hypothetical protein
VLSRYCPAEHAEQPGEPATDLEFIPQAVHDDEAVAPVVAR